MELKTRCGQTDSERQFEALVKKYVVNREKIPVDQRTGDGRYAAAFSKLEKEITCKALYYALLVVYDGRPVIYTNEGIGIVSRICKEIKARQTKIYEIVLSGNLAELEELVKDLSEEALYQDFLLGTRYNEEGVAYGMASLEELLKN